VLSGCLPREDIFADQTTTHILIDDHEYFANLVGTGGVRLSLSFVVVGRVERLWLAKTLSVHEINSLHNPSIP